MLQIRIPTQHILLSLVTCSLLDTEFFRKSDLFYELSILCLFSAVKIVMLLQEATKFGRQMTKAAMRIEVQERFCCLESQIHC